MRSSSQGGTLGRHPISDQLTESQKERFRKARGGYEPEELLEWAQLKGFLIEPRKALPRGFWGVAKKQGRVIVGENGDGHEIRFKNTGHAQRAGYRSSSITAAMARGGTYRGYRWRWE